MTCILSVIRRGPGWFPGFANGKRFSGTHVLGKPAGCRSGGGLRGRPAGGSCLLPLLQGEKLVTPSLWGCGKDDVFGG